MAISGTAVGAYCMLPPSFGHGITSFMNTTFELDGAYVGSMEEIAATNEWTYNVSVLSKDGLENKEHTLVISPQGQDGKMSSYLVFDYITYE